MSTITVTATNKSGENEPNQVILWEKDNRHPKGEVFITNDGKSYRVGDTPAIKTLLLNERLTKVESKAATKEEPKPAAGAKTDDLKQGNPTI